MNRDKAHARRIIEETERELVEHRCEECGRKFAPAVSLSGHSTYHYCSGECALAAMVRRERSRGQD